LISPHTHEQNGPIKRKYRHINETDLTLLAGSSLPLKLWGEAFMTGVTIINALPTPVLDNHSPYGLMFQRQRNYNLIKIFGSACYLLLRPLIFTLLYVYFWDTIQIIEVIYVCL